MSFSFHFPSWAACLGWEGDSVSKHGAAEQAAPCFLSGGENGET
ncbi:hypothetical protein CLOSTMETH_03460 [[Clostridium] methylpentosum DSM 5476]|uniref:Uncharacterized protein n=1 Tax=[Clostridium] methylpentosum DSM 5476 TaxID=537013 RepID=C0EHW5_9FIRM|nr:hypothetical protein CLOSTMETH_03460 [[Clostridium] methylpentosum DSM 5476]